MEAQIEFIEKECPECHTIIRAHPEYVTWCQNCGWNVRPLQPDPPSNLIEKIYSSLGERHSKRLYEQISKRTNLKPAWTVTRIAAFLMAILTHLMTLGLFLLGARMLIFGLPDIVRVVTIFLGITFVGFAWVLRPRFAELPKKYVLTKEQAPTFYVVVNRIAQALGAKAPDYLLVTPEFNASFYRAGWQRKRVVMFGLPLLALLDDAERVALIGHELAHDVNGDSSRVFIVSTAISSLVGWYEMIRPPRIWNPRAGLMGLAMVPFNVIVFLIAGFGWIGAFILAHLLWWDIQRAEYYADYLGATVGGTGAMLGMLEKLHHASSFTTVLQWVALNPAYRDENLFAMIRKRITSVPAAEKERVKRVQQMSTSRLDVTHPPTTFRIDALSAHPVGNVAVRIDRAESAAIEKELAQVEPEIQKKLVELRKAGYFVQ